MREKITLPEMHRTFGTDIEIAIDMIDQVASRPELRLIYPLIDKRIAESNKPDSQTNKNIQISQSDGCNDCKGFSTLQTLPNCWLHAVVLICLSVDNLSEKSLKEIHRIYHLLHLHIDKERGKFWKRIHPYMAFMQKTVENPQGGDQLRRDADRHGIITLETKISVPEDTEIVKLDNEFYKVVPMTLSCPVVSGFTKKEKELSENQYNEYITRRDNPQIPLIKRLQSIWKWHASMDSAKINKGAITLQIEHVLHLFLNHSHDPPMYRVIGFKYTVYMTREFIENILNSKVLCGLFFFEKKSVSETERHAIGFVVCKDSPKGPCTLKLLDSHNPSQFGSYPLKPIGEPSEKNEPFEYGRKDEPVWYFHEGGWEAGWLIGLVEEKILLVRTVDENVIDVKLSHLRRRWPLGIQIDEVIVVVMNEERSSWWSSWWNRKKIFNPFEA